MTVAIPFILLTVVIAYLVLEKVSISRRVNKLSIRIHVNGTRGKSSVTRYVAAGLRAAGYRPLAKITGIYPTIIDPQGGEKLIQRRGPAHIREQLRMIRRANNASCDALVLECMSISPALQHIETVTLRPHITVLTNILDDHREELGISAQERVEAYCTSLPAHAIVITNEMNNRSAIEKACKTLETKIVMPSVIDRSLVKNLPPEIIEDNLILALATCRALGIDAKIAIDAILSEGLKHKSALQEFHLGNHRVRFVNGFAVNDIPSAVSFMDVWRRTLGGWKQLIIILNTRADRPLRSVEFAKWCASMGQLSGIVLIGSHVHLTRRMLLQSGYPSDKIYSWSKAQVRAPLETLREMIVGETVIFGYGNIAGDGFLLLDSLENVTTILALQ